MVLVEDFIESILEHAAPKYYDPVKAHEYYERTKELKGREGGLKKESQKRAWEYSKEQISEAKKKELASAAETKKASFEKIRATAELRRKEIRDKLNVLLEQLSKNIADESKEASAKIKALPPIPKGLSRAAAAKAQKDRSEEIARIRGEVAKSREAVGTQKKSARESSGSELEQIRGEMKATLETARTNYQALKEELKAKYEKESQQEFEAIKQNV